MESLQHRHLANESFSYSWLINDPSRRPISGSRRPSWETLDFDFGIGLQQSEPILHADQLFSDGLLLPLHLLPPPLPATDRPSCSNGDNGDSTVKKTVVEKRRRWGSKRVIAKYVMGFLKPLYTRFGGRRRAAQGKVGPETMSCPVSLLSTPRTSCAYSSMGFDVEDSIYEAVLHCKKSITVYNQEGH